MERELPKDDRELEQMTGITPADHQFTSPAAIREQERKMLGPAWFRPRPKKKERE